MTSFSKLNHVTTTSVEMTSKSHHFDVFMTKRCYLGMLIIIINMHVLWACSIFDCCFLQLIEIIILGTMKLVKKYVVVLVCEGCSNHRHTYWINQVYTFVQFFPRGANCVSCLLLVRDLS